MMTSMCLRILCQLLMMLTFCFLLGNANNQNANSTDPNDSEAHINATVSSPDDLRDINGGHHDDHAEPSTSNSQNVLSSESEATSDSDFQTPPAIQKAIEESLKEHQTKRNNAKYDDDGPKNPMKQSELDERLFEQAEIQPKPKLASIDIQEDGLTDAELKALHRLNSNATPNTVLKYLDEESRAKVIQAYEQINGNGAESSWMAENRAPARNKITTQQETLNESDGLDDQEDEALEELLKGNEKVLSKLNEKSRLKVLNVAEKLGVEPSAVGQQQMKVSPYTDQYHWTNFLLEDGWDDDKTNQYYGDLSNPSISRSKSMAQHGGTLSAKSPLKGFLQALQSAQFNRKFSKSLPHKRNEETTSESETGSERETGSESETGSKSKTGSGSEPESKSEPGSKSKTGSKSETESKSKTGSKGKPGSKNKTESKGKPGSGSETRSKSENGSEGSTETGSESEDELPARSKHHNMPGWVLGVPTNKEKLALGAQLRQMSIGKSREMPTTSYGNMSHTDVNRGLLAKLIERSNHRDLGMDSATAQSKKAKEEKQKRGNFDKNLAEHENGSSTDSP